MGEEKRKALLDGDDAPRIVAICPVCKHEFIADGKTKMLVNSYMIPLPQPGGQMGMAASLPMIICTQCGVQFFSGESLKELQKREKGERTNIILPQSRVNLSRVN